MGDFSQDDTKAMRRALRLAARAYGETSPNPMVGAVLMRDGAQIGQGWHRRAGGPHAEIEALRDAERRRHSARGATLYVTLEPCCTQGRTPPCTEAIIAAGISRVVVAATDPNPRHAGRGFDLLRAAGIRVETGLLAEEAARLNEAFNHWIVTGMPFVTVKAAMTLDGKIATAAGESKWVTGEQARAEGMRLRQGADAILVGINTVLADNPALTFRPAAGRASSRIRRRLVLDTAARTPLDATLVSDPLRDTTTVFVGRDAPARRVAALARRVNVVPVATRGGRLDLRTILRRLGREGITRVLVEGGGEVNAAFLERGLAQRIAFFHAPLILGEGAGRRAVAGPGATGWPGIRRLREPVWRRLGPDLYLTARVD